MRCIIAALIMLVPALPAAAQNVLVVPEGQAVVVPPRSAGPIPRPRPVFPPETTPRAFGQFQPPPPIAAAPPVAPPAAAGAGLLSGQGLLALPLAALGAVMAGGGLPGSGGSATTAPARTR